MNKSIKARFEAYFGISLSVKNIIIAIAVISIFALIMYYALPAFEIMNIAVGFAVKGMWSGAILYSLLGSALIVLLTMAVSVISAFVVSIPVLILDKDSRDWLFKGLTAKDQVVPSQAIQVKAADIPLQAKGDLASEMSEETFDDKSLRNTGQSEATRETYFIV